MMFKNKTDVGDHIILSSLVLKHLKKLSQPPIKVYIFLCSCNQPVTASIASIAAAVGLNKRATIDALKTLEKDELISRGPGRGDGPNEYRVLFAVSVAPPAPERPVDPSVPAPQSGAIPEPIAIPQPIKNPPKLLTIREMLATRYRPLNDEEFAMIHDWFPNDADLRNRLELMTLRGDGVAPEMEVGFFIGALKQAV
jgi:hypothetical protein